MGSLTGVKNIPDGELEENLQIAYGDLRFVVERIIAIRRRINPSESGMDALAGVLYYLNQEADRIISQVDEI